MSDFLEIQRSEGRYFDSSAFSIDSLTALEKLSQHQLPGSGLWLVKLVQAAVAAGAESVDISFGNRWLGVSFTPQQDWQADEILRTVLSGAIPSDRAMSHLVAALRASSASKTEAVCWSCGDAQVFLGHQICRVSPQSSGPTFRLEAHRPPRSRSLGRMLSSSVYHLAKQTVEEYDALRAHCWVSPIPITVDGRPFATGYDRARGGWVEESVGQVFRGLSNSRNYTVESCLGIRPLSLPSSDRPPLPYLAPKSEAPFQVAALVYPGETFLRWTQSDPTCQGVVALLSGPTAESKVELVLDGAVVESRRLKRWDLGSIKAFGINLGIRHPVGLRFIFAVRPQELDLSGFSVRELDLDALLGQATDQAVELLQAIESQVTHFYYLPVNRRFSKLAGLGIGTHLTLATILTKGIALLPVAGMFGLVAAGNTAHWRSQIKGQVRQLLQLMGEG